LKDQPKPGIIAVIVETTGMVLVAFLILPNMLFIKDAGTVLVALRTVASTLFAKDEKST
jgi:hypothetical protein